MAAYDFKKEYKDLYAPGIKPVALEIPEMRLIAVDGKGDPNVSDGEYAKAVELLYALTYSIKMKNKSLEGYFDYVVPPLEGFWQFDDGHPYRPGMKSHLVWTSLIRQPAFVTQALFDAACAEVARKKPGLDTAKARLTVYTEGLCVQVMHIGPYDDEPETVARLDAFALSEGYALDFSDTRRHHEIYLGDPRRTAPEKLKTIIRHPIRHA